MVLVLAVRADGKRVGLVPDDGRLARRASRASSRPPERDVRSGRGHDLRQSDAVRAARRFFSATRARWTPTCARSPRRAEIRVHAVATEEIYPPGFSTYVDPPAVARPLEGQFRPGHFRGVLHGRSQAVSACAGRRRLFRPQRLSAVSGDSPNDCGFESADGDRRAADGSRSRWTGDELAKSVSLAGASASALGDFSGAADRQKPRTSAGEEHRSSWRSHPSTTGGIEYRRHRLCRDRRSRYAGSSGNRQADAISPSRPHESAERD